MPQQYEMQDSNFLKSDIDQSLVFADFVLLFVAVRNLLLEQSNHIDRWLAHNGWWTVKNDWIVNDGERLNYWLILMDDSITLWCPWFSPSCSIPITTTVSGPFSFKKWAVWILWRDRVKVSRDSKSTMRAFLYERRAVDTLSNCPRKLFHLTLFNINYCPSRWIKHVTSYLSDVFVSKRRRKNLVAVSTWEKGREVLPRTFHHHLLNHVVPVRVGTSTSVNNNDDVQERDSIQDDQVPSEKANSWIKILHSWSIF